MVIGVPPFEVGAVNVAVAEPLLVLIAVIVGAEGTVLTITFTIVATPSTTSLLEIKLGVVNVPIRLPKFIENNLVEVEPEFPFLKINSVNGLSKLAIKEAEFSKEIPLKLLPIPVNLVLLEFAGDTPIVNPVGLLTV